MQYFVFLQRLMASSLTTGIVIHDYYYIDKYFQVSFYSLSLVLAIAYFHLLVFLEHSGIAEIKTAEYVPKINRMRFFVGIAGVIICLLDIVHKSSLNLIAFPSTEYILNALFSLLLVTFPDTIIKLIFQFQQNKRK